MPEVRVDDLTVTYGGDPAVDDVTLVFPEAETTVLLGPSGSGKSTLLLAVAGLLAPSAGSIRIGDRVVADAGHRIDVAPERRHLGLVFQSHALWPHMTVLDNVEFPLRHGGHGIDRAARRARARETLALVGLDGYERRHPHELSGGQSQRVSLARALVYRPDVLLMDEPLSALDAVVRRQMRREIADIQRRLATTMIYVTHDREDAEHLADNLVLMRDGGVIEQGPLEAVYRAPRRRFTAEFLLNAILVDGVVRDDRLELAAGAAVPLTGDAPAAGLPSVPGLVGLPPAAVAIEPDPGGQGEVVAMNATSGEYRYAVALGRDLRWEATTWQRIEVGARVAVSIRADALFALEDAAPALELAG